MKTKNLIKKLKTYPKEREFIYPCIFLDECDSVDYMKCNDIPMTVNEALYELKCCRSDGQLQMDSRDIINIRSKKKKLYFELQK